MLRVVVLLFVLASTALPSNTFAQKDSKPRPKPPTEAEILKMDKGKMRPPSGAGFYLGPVDGAAGRFSLLLTDEQQGFVEQSYLVGQLALIEAVMVEARTFALTDEGVGTTRGVITRFSDKQEASFIVDVEKAGRQSLIYVTVKSITGKRLTVPAGSINRGAKPPDEKGFFFQMLERMKEMRESAS
jgi:hypothetical protein